MDGSLAREATEGSMIYITGIWAACAVVALVWCIKAVWEAM